MKVTEMKDLPNGDATVQFDMSEEEKLLFFRSGLRRIVADETVVMSPEHVYIQYVEEADKVKQFEISDELFNDIVRSELLRTIEAEADKIKEEEGE